VERKLPDAAVRVKSSLKISLQPGRFVRPPGTVAVVVGATVVVVVVVEPAVVVGGTIVVEVVVVGVTVVAVGDGVSELVGDADGRGVPVVLGDGRQRGLWPFGCLHGSAPTRDRLPIASALRRESAATVAATIVPVVLRRRRCRPLRRTRRNMEPPLRSPTGLAVGFGLEGARPPVGGFTPRASARR
jgi:hypothetical protein